MESAIEKEGEERTAVVGDGERGAQREWHLYLELRRCSGCESWRCAGLAR